MKMSPPGVNFCTAVQEFPISVVDRNLSVEKLQDPDSGTGKAEALRLGRVLEVARVPLHDVIVADQAFMMEAADMVEALGSGTPSFCGFARRASEAAVLVWQ